MGDDFRDLNLDKLTRRELKTAEQISKHTIDGYLENRSVDRALHLLTVGDELQKISVMKVLPQLIKEDLTACTQRVIPRMQQTLPHGTTEYNMGACEAVRVVAHENLMSPENFTKVFLQHILNSLESRDTVAAEEWLNVLLDVIQVLPTTVLQNEVLPIAVNKAHISKPVAVRITSCKILGRLALSFSPFLVKKDINPVVISLCQDVSGDVRAAMSTELPNISATLGLETGTYLLNHVLDLVSDEELLVREAAIEAVAQMLPRFTPEILKNTIIPLTKKVFTEIMKNENPVLIVLSKVYGQYAVGLKKILKNTIIPLTKKVFTEIMKNENPVLIVLSKVYGQYAVGLKNVMSPPEKVQYLQRYIQLSQLNANVRRKLNPYVKTMVVDEDELAMLLTECRLNCAYNMPAMVVFSVDLKQDSIDALFAVFKSLASDSFCLVRRKIAAGFYQVMKLMPKWHANLKLEFIKLLKDDIDMVLEGLVPNISDILISFAASNTLTNDKADSGKDIGQGLFVCEKNLSEALHWRLHEELLLSFQAIPKVFHPEFVYLYFVPLLMSRATNGRILPCRIAALHALLVIIVDPSQSKQKTKIRNKLLELCNNSSFHCRMIFLRGMFILINLSPEVLKELFFQNITSMADDKVPNVRLLVCKILPKLKALATDPVDLKLLASIEACVSMLSGEQDKDVATQLKQALLQMEDLDKSKGIKKPVPEPELRSSREVPVKGQSDIAPLTDIRSFTREARAKTNTSQYSVAQRHSGLQTPSVMSSRSLAVSTGSEGRSQSVQRSIPGPRAQQSPSPTPTRLQRQPTDTDSKRLGSVPKFSPDEFLVDAGIPLKSTKTEVKRIPTPRPVHRQTVPANEVEVMESEHQKQTETKENLREKIQTPTRPARNINVNNNYFSNLPVKKTQFRSLTHEEIEQELLTSETVQPYSPRLSDRLRYKPKTTKIVKKENKRYSLDMTNTLNTQTKIETRSMTINKRYSLNVDSSKINDNKKTLSLINNNTMRSTRLSSTRSGVVRPQSCILQTEKVNNAKRSMSVENLPPKVTRLVSRLPVRATDTKPSKPK